MGASIGSLRELYDKADGFAREVAQYRDDVAIPAHNELRYAGHHLLQALDDNGEVSDEEQMRRACAHCERAMYEAGEAGIVYALRQFNQFRQDYRNVIVSEVVGDYAAITKLALSAQSEMSRARSRESPPLTTDRYLEVFRELREKVALLEASRDDLNAKQRQLKADSRRFFVRCGLIFLGMLVTAAFSFYLA